MTNNSQCKNTERQKEENDSTVDKMVEQISEVLGGSDEGWESPTEAKAHETADEGTDYVPTEDKVVRDPETGEKKLMKDK